MCKHQSKYCLRQSFFSFFIFSWRRRMCCERQAGRIGIPFIGKMTCVLKAITSTWPHCHIYCTRGTFISRHVHTPCILHVVASCTFPVPRVTWFWTVKSSASVSEGAVSTVVVHLSGRWEGPVIYVFCLDGQTHHWTDKTATVGPVYISCCFQTGAICHG